MKQFWGGMQLQETRQALWTPGLSSGLEKTLLCSQTGEAESFLAGKEGQGGLGALNGGAKERSPMVWKGLASWTKQNNTY